MKSPAQKVKQHLCTNCLMAAQGVYCPHCGQKHHSPIRHFSQLISELFTDILNFDSKLLNTMKPLLFRPGFLSQEYFDGRRMRYVSPLKLYFFLSIVTFFLIQYSINAKVHEETVRNETSQTGPEQEAAKKDARLENFHIGNFNGKEWNAETNPVAIDWLPAAANTLINEKLSRIEQVAKSDDWREQTVRAALTASPQALLVILPFFALLLKVFYFFQKRLYMEHMIVALHNHSFLLLAIAMVVVFDTLQNWWGQPVVWQSLGADLAGLILLWVPVYFFLSLKTVYRQSWKKTVLKYLGIGFAYLFLFVAGLVINLILAILFL